MPGGTEHFGTKKQPQGFWGCLCVLWLWLLVALFFFRFLEKEKNFPGKRFNVSSSRVAIKANIEMTVVRQQSAFTVSDIVESRTASYLFKIAIADMPRITHNIDIAAIRLSVWLDFCCRWDLRFFFILKKPPKQNFNAHQQTPFRENVITYIIQQSRHKVKKQKGKTKAPSLCLRFPSNFLVLKQSCHLKIFL